MSSNITITSKDKPRTSAYSDSLYYPYYLKYPNKEGVMTEYMIEVTVSPHADNKSYNIFVKRVKEKDYLYINPSAAYQVNNLPFTYSDAKAAVENYEMKQTLTPDTIKTFEDIIDEL